MKIHINPTINPITAVNMGKPATKNTPKVTARITNAAITPTASEAPTTSIFENATSPPNSVSTPAFLVILILCNTL